jgi:hypothetical protein
MDAFATVTFGVEVNDDVGRTRGEAGIGLTGGAELAFEFGPGDTGAGIGDEFRLFTALAGAALGVAVTRVDQPAALVAVETGRFQAAERVEVIGNDEGRRGIHGRWAVGRL